MKVEDLKETLSEINDDLELEAMVDPFNDSDILLYYNEDGSDDYTVVARF